MGWWRRRGNKEIDKPHPPRPPAGRDGRKQPLPPAVRRQPCRAEACGGTLRRPAAGSGVDGGSRCGRGGQFLRRRPATSVVSLLVVLHSSDARSGTGRGAALVAASTDGSDQVHLGTPQAAAVARPRSCSEAAKSGLYGVRTPCDPALVGSTPPDKGP